MNLQVAKRQETTIAIINSHDPPKHDGYGYRFSVNGHPFTGWAYHADKHDFSMGEQIIVYYDPLDPGKNSTNDFQMVGIGDLFFVPFCLMAMVALPLVIFFQRRPRLNTCKKPLTNQ